MILLKNRDRNPSFKKGEYVEINDAGNYPMELSVDGVCKQQTTTGKNLLPNKIQTKTINGVTCTNNGDGTVTLNGTTTAKTYFSPFYKDFISLSLDGNYTFSANTYNNLGYSLYHGDTELFFGDTKSNKTFSATGSFNNVRPQINIESGVTLNNVIVKFQLEKGSTATEYEPYTEGQATPSPDYPQEIKTITDSLSVTSNNGKDETEENYLESVITANLPEGEFIGKIDDTYKDTLKVVYKEDGKHHLVLNKKLKKTIFVGADDENWTQPANKTELFQIVMADMRMLQDAYTKATLLSNLLIPTTPNKLLLTNIDGITNLNGTRHIRVRFKDNPFTTVTDFKTWLSTHNLEVYYVLESPYEVDLGIVDMPLSYSGVTNIFTDSDLLPKINAKYYKDFEFDKILRSGYNIDEQEYEIAKKQMANGKRKRILSSYDDCIIKINLGLLDNKTYQEYKEQLNDGEFHYWSYKYNQYKKANFILTKPSINTEYAYDDDIGINDMEITLEKSSDIE